MLYTCAALDPDRIQPQGHTLDVHGGLGVPHEPRLHHALPGSSISCSKRPTWLPASLGLQNLCVHADCSTGVKSLCKMPCQQDVHIMLKETCLATGLLGSPQSVCVCMQTVSTGVDFLHDMLALPAIIIACFTRHTWLPACWGLHNLSVCACRLFNGVKSLCKILALSARFPYHAQKDLLGRQLASVSRKSVRACRLWQRG